MHLLTDYERQIWTGLAADDWGTVEISAGDVVYLMDLSQCWIFDGSAMHQLPDLGGGGGNEILTWTVTIVNNLTTGTTTQKRISGYSRYDSDDKVMKPISLTAGQTNTFTICAALSGGSGKSLLCLYVNNPNTPSISITGSGGQLWKTFTDSTLTVFLIYINSDENPTITISN